MIDAREDHGDSSGSLSFKDLCNTIYGIICEKGVMCLHEIYWRFPKDMAGKIDLVLKALLDDGCISNASKGYVPEHPPVFRSEYVCKNKMSETGPDIRIDKIRSIETRLVRVLRDGGEYYPSDSIECAIGSLSPGTTKAVLSAFFLNGIDVDELMSLHGSKVQKIISDFCKDHPADSNDRRLFGIFDIPYNVLIYIMNRSVPYERLICSTEDCGFGDICTMLFDYEGKGVYNPVHPSSIETFDLQKRAKDAIVEYVGSNQTDPPRDYIDALLVLMSDVPHRISLIKDVACTLAGLSNTSISDDKWSAILDPFMVTKGYIKCLSSGNIVGLKQYLDSIKEVEYGISVEKLFKSKMEGIKHFRVDSPEELKQFIERYTSYKVVDDRILIGGSFEDSLRRYIEARGSLNPDSISIGYARLCGGPRSMIDATLSRMDLMPCSNAEDNLTSDELDVILKKLEGYEWISQSNAQSLFRDICGIGDKFNNRNMLKLGYQSSQDVFFKQEYQTFRNCILKTEFYGDEHYIGDSIRFRINMKNNGYKMVVESLERALDWIPVSNERFINLKSERYSQFRIVLEGYGTKIRRICCNEFVTPFLLKNMRVDIPDIDDDDFGIEFYEAMLLSSKTRISSLGGHRFFFEPSSFSDFRCSAPDFIRYISYRNGGFASMERIQGILESTYGIDIDLPSIRSQARRAANETDCIFSESNDTLYIDEDSYMDAMNYDD